MKKVLIIEDNKEISANIKEYLELDDFEVETAFDGEVGLDKLLSKKYDLILLDLMLPEIDGFTIARKVCDKIDTPIIMITAKDSIDDKLKGFDYGALDYIVKPFDLRELDVRIKSIFKKAGTSNKVIKFEDLEIDIVKRVFHKSGKEVSLTQKEYLILEKLIINIGSPVSRTDIIEHVWGGGDSMFDSDAKLDVYISTLRNKLSKTLITTIKGFGYKIDEL